MSKPTKAELQYWLRQSKDKNLGQSIREHYKQKLREAGYKA